MMTPEKRRATLISPILAILGPGITVTPAIWLFSPVLGMRIGLAWLINFMVFMPPWLILATIPRLRSVSVVLMFSGFRLVCLPMVLFAVKNRYGEIDPSLLGWTLALYVLNLISMTAIESRIRA